MIDDESGTIEAGDAPGKPPGPPIVPVPATAGEGLGRLVAEGFLSRPGTVELLVDAYVDGLKATVTKISKTGQVVVCTDFLTRIKAAESLLANIVGKPVERVQSVVVTQNADSQSDEMDERRLATSPALVAALERKLARAKRAQKRLENGQSMLDVKRVTVHAEVVDVD